MRRNSSPPYRTARSPGRRAAEVNSAATDTRIFQQAVSTASGVLFIRGRLKFGVLRPNRRQAAASHPSCLIGWNVDLSSCKHLGLVVA